MLLRYKWRHNDVIVGKVIDIDQNSRSKTAMFSFQIVGRIRRQSSWARCELRSRRRRRRDSTRQSSVCIGLNCLYRNQNVSRDRHYWYRLRRLYVKCVDSLGVSSQQNYSVSSCAFTSRLLQRCSCTCRSSCLDTGASRLIHFHRHRHCTTPVNTVMYKPEVLIT